MKRIMFFVLALTLAISCSLFVYAEKSSGVSGRVTPSEWAKEDVEEALTLGILDADKTYYYGSLITREAFCEIIDRFIDTESSVFGITSMNAPNPFTDTDSQATYSLYNLDIIKGKSETIFAPDDFITREEAAVIFSRLLNYNSNLKAQSSKKNLVRDYDDYEEISSWAEDAVNRMTNLGIMEGYGEKVFSPKGIYTIEEAVVMVMRLQRLCRNTENMFSVVSFADGLNLNMPEDENYMFSPLSIKMALALAANGAEGETKKDILDCMLINDLDSYNEYSKSLIDRYSKSDKLTLSISNSVWVNTDNCPHNFKDGYKKAVSDYYNGESGQVNNKNAVDTINGWVNEKTNEKIPSIIDDSDFWAALVNAIYFKGAWENDFSERLTKPDTFHSADGTESKIDFMNQTDRFQYCNTNGVEIVKLPYKSNFMTEDENGKIMWESAGANISMYLIKTDDSSVEKTLNNAELDYKRIKLSVPKFKVEYSEEITKYLEFGTATSRNLADFSGMMNLSADEDLWIDKILHKTYISVDEEGTEAAAVTAVMMEGATSARPEDPIEVKFDKPFYFVIRDDTNGEILFMGRYAYAE